MKGNLQFGDELLYEPPKGEGTRLEIRYALPRTQVNRGQNVKTVLPAPPKSFTIKCPVCGGEGVIKDRFGTFPPQKCPAIGCNKGWQTLNGSEDDYKVCGICGGTGKVNNDFSVRGWDVCECGGTGRVKVR